MCLFVRWPFDERREKCQKNGADSKEANSVRCDSDAKVNEWIDSPVIIGRSTLINLMSQRQSGHLLHLQHVNRGTTRKAVDQLSYPVLTSRRGPFGLRKLAFDSQASSR